jgi:hypothetical protein
MPKFKHVGFKLDYDEIGLAQGVTCEEEDERHD